MKKNKTKKRFEGDTSKGESKYAKKIALQKRGIFSINSPFKLNDIIGVSITEMIRLRFKRTI